MGFSKARILEWVAIPFSRGSSRPRDWTRVSSTAGRFFTIWNTREAREVFEKCSLWCRQLRGGLGGQEDSLEVVDWLGGLRAVGRKLQVEKREESTGQLWRKLLRIGFRKMQEKQNHRFLKPVRLIQSQPSKKTKRSHLAKNEVHPSFKGRQHSNTLFINLRTQVLKFKSTSWLVTSKCRKGWLKKIFFFVCKRVRHDLVTKQQWQQSYEWYTSCFVMSWKYFILNFYFKLKDSQQNLCSGLLLPWSDLIGHFRSASNCLVSSLANQDTKDTTEFFQRLLWPQATSIGLK